MKKQSQELDFSGPSIFDRLPAFTWNEEQAPKVRRLHSDNKSPSWGRYNQIPEQSATVSAQDALSKLREASVRPGAKLMVLRGVSKQLEESDFFRLDFKGDHIEGWARGLIKGATLPS